MKREFLHLSETELDPVFDWIDNILEGYFKKDLKPVLLFSGGMGAGKTTFIRHWFQRKNPSSLVNSPTFALYQVYDSENFSLYHFDLYRIQHEEELFNLGFTEIWGIEGVSAIEWWEKGKTFLNSLPKIEIQIEMVNLDRRNYTVVSDEVTSF